MKTILLTGSSGFIGSHIFQALRNPGKFCSDCHSEHKVYYTSYGVDALIGAHSKKNHYMFQTDREFVANIADRDIMDNIFRITRPEYVIHCAAESFVCDSIASAIPFIQSNVVGTQIIIDLCLKYCVEKLLYISTDEVYGHLEPEEQSWTEQSVPNPRNPYSASKFAGEVLVRAAHETHGLQYLITRSSNNFGSCQQERNLIPKAITSILNDLPVPIHGDGKNIREWLYVEDNVAAILTVLQKGTLNNIYNIGSGVELSNLELVDKINLWINNNTGLQSKINFIPDRKGHDRRYSINCDKIKTLGWKPKNSFNHNLIRTIEWYKTNPDYYKE